MTTPEPPTSPPEPSWREALAIPLGLLGAILGALAGGYVYYLVYTKTGLIAPFLVGVGTGIGTRALVRRGSIPLAVIAALVAAFGAIIAEWARRPLTPPLLGFLAQTPHAFDHIPYGWTFALIGAIAAAFVTWAAPPRPPNNSSL